MVEVNYNPYDDFWIRGEPCCGGNGFPGSIDNVRLWNKVLSYTEIMNYATNREPQIAVDEPGLVGYWKFDEVGGNIAYDFSINGKNGIINGTPIRKRDINGVQAIGLTAQYLISLDIVDTKSPQVISDSLPTASSTDIISSFIVKYSEDMNSSTINNSTNYDLRSAGIDGIFDTQDDEIYTVNPLGYTAGLTASYTIPDGPLQPGQYRFIVKTNIQDKFLNPLLTNYVKYFTVISIPGIVNETRNNNTIATATPLGVITNISDGSFSVGSTFAVGSNPQSIAAARINSDTNLDIVTANYSSDNITILSGNGDGTFMTFTNYPAGDGPVSVAIADLNQDNKNDIVTANYNSHNVSVFINLGDGLFSNAVNYSVGNNPYWVELVDVNGDSNKDIVTANFNGDNVTIWFGAGDGSFTNRSDIAANDGALCVAYGDVNGDGKVDLVVAGYYSQNVKLLLGNGSGGFSDGGTIPVGGNCRFVRVGDINGDGKLDIAALDTSNWTIKVFYGDGQGGFSAAVSYGNSLYNAYQFALVDLNGDGRLDLIVPTYDYDTVIVMLGKVDGGFESQVAYSTVYDSYVIAVCAGDFNSDGILDIAGANYYRGNITILTGNKSLAIRNVTSTGYSISTARGNLTDTSDVDYWSFSGSVGDRFILAVDNPFNPNDSGLYYRIYNPVGSDIGGFYSDSRGYGQYSFTISSSGRHYIRVSYNYNYFGEYRFNLVKVPPQIQVETEDNNSLNNANVLNFALIGNNRVANITGVIHINDTAGDYFKIGNLSYGSSINLSLFQPDDYKFPSILEIYNQSGQLLTNTSVTGTNLSYNIPIGGDSTYYARVYSGQVGFSNIKRSALNINAQQVRVPNNNILNFGTNDFSVETLIYVSPLTLGYNTYYEIVSKSAYYYNNAGWSLDINTYGIYPYYRAIFLNT
ncbi:MAG: FG-GAP-like repeat-containing protein, partial [Limisphaerales bacterium]